MWKWPSGNFNRKWIKWTEINRKNSALKRRRRWFDCFFLCSAKKNFTWNLAIVRAVSGQCVCGIRWSIAAAAAVCAAFAITDLHPYILNCAHLLIAVKKKCSPIYIFKNRAQQRIRHGVQYINRRKRLAKKSLMNLCCYCFFFLLLSFRSVSLARPFTNTW